MSDRDLARAASEARNMAYAPYSKFRVGAALLLEDGSIMTAANLENASFGLSVCAERNLAARAIHAHRRDWVKLAIATDAEGFIPPCGACLQVIREFVEDIEILLVNNRGETEGTRLSDLLPKPFTDFPS
ncbi:MAG: cytidine deaminase [bacterium]|nr:cytidine deaminase [bacterium]